ncbi:hypothetical protein E2C01_014163 [Portunus trituberculatus]|uniref:Uncharacterized protein n=1 Tax=Portunus trituberculatus TaxID=210409 RepID=A0A5B7DJH3_PORTR|nr:hypothetical protein [Portunus trituberculatus]
MEKQDLWRTKIIERNLKRNEERETVEKHKRGAEEYSVGFEKQDVSKDCLHSLTHSGISFFFMSWPIALVGNLKCIKRAVKLPPKKCFPYFLLGGCGNGSPGAFFVSHQQRGRQMEQEESAPPPFPPSEIHAKLMGKNWMPEEILIDFTLKNLLLRGASGCVKCVIYKSIECNEAVDRVTVQADSRLMRSVLRPQRVRVYGALQTDSSLGHEEGVIGFAFIVFVLQYDIYITVTLPHYQELLV